MQLRYDSAVCTFCSVRGPWSACGSSIGCCSRRQLLMFEHVRSKIGPFGIFLDLMTPLSGALAQI